MRRSESHRSISRQRRPGRERVALLRAAVVVPSLFLPGLAVAIDLQAQPVDLSVAPSVGWYLPADLLYRSDFPPARATMNRALSLGLGVQAALPTLPVALRVELERADWFDTDVVGEVPSTGPGEAPTLRFAVPSAVTLLTGNVILRPETALAGLRPYGFLGLGIKNYAFGDEEPPDEVGFTMPMDGTSGVIHYGAGVEVQVLGRTVTPELGGHYSRYVLVDEEHGGSRAEAQHELILALKVHFDLVTADR
jgi:hypothetical protein